MLHDYQEKAVRWMLERPCGYLAIDMGLGKTRCVLEFLRRSKVKALVVAPLRVAISTWPQEIRKWAPELTYHVLHGDGRDLKASVRDTDVFIINYDGLKWLAMQRLDIMRGRTLILDEATAVKSHKAVRTKLLAKMRPLFDKCYCLSATPSPNGVQDLWAQYRIMDCGISLGTHWTPFFNRYFIKDGYYRIFKRYPEVDKEIIEKVAPRTFRLSSEDYLKLPDFVYNDVSIEMPVALQEQYRAFEQDFLFDLGNETTVTAMNAATLSMKLRQFIQGALYTEGRKYQVLHTLKFDALESIQEQLDGNPNLVAINFKFELEEIHKRFAGRYAAIVGGSSTKDSAKIIDQWNTGKLPMLVVHPAAISHGINLQAGGHYITWLSLTWNYEHYVQLNGRLRRQGQKYPVVLNRVLLDGTIDARVAKALKSKQASQEEVLKALAT